ncbi:EAL domain-containing protein [Kordiimonas pumila]|uniref:EAL domain-containing protein n=1 Tax=Kordiimonas pumila TaxID=2161677 RepID=A0ABV7D6X6_9PROT|nr:EAL domain-containing protein [Kordiimonas pumila]
MAPVTQILLLLSYAILGAAVVIIPPRLLGFDSDMATFLGMAVFFGAWQVQNVLVNGRSLADAQQRIAKLEDSATILRKDLERTRRELENRGREGEEKSELLVSELKVLQTLLSQVTKKELELKGGLVPSDMPLPTEEEAMSLSIDAKNDSGVETDTALLAKQADDDDVSDDALTAAEIEELDLTPEEVALVVRAGKKPEADDVVSEAGDSAPTGPAGRSATRRGLPVKKKAPIRIIKREDQLLSVVRSSLSENRVDLYMQPIVSLPSRRTVHFECFSRMRDEEGRIILPRQYMKVAESKGLIGTIDNLLLFRLIQLVRRMGKRRPDLRFFCNMSRYSMADEEFFPQFIDFMTANEEFSRRLIFEVSQEDYNLLDGSVLDRLQTLARKGFGFSMDSVTSFEQDFAALEERRFQFIKADINDLATAHPDEGDADAFKASLRRKGMQLIASRIETEDKVLQALEGHIEFAQGYLFGEPAEASELNREL